MKRQKETASGEAVLDSTKWSQGRDSNPRYTVLQFAPVRPKPRQPVPFCHSLYLRRRPFLPARIIAYHHFPCTWAAIRRQLLRAEALSLTDRQPNNRIRIGRCEGEACNDLGRRSQRYCVQQDRARQRLEYHTCRIRAYNAAGNSTPSNTAEATTPCRGSRNASQIACANIRENQQICRAQLAWSASAHAWPARVGPSPLPSSHPGRTSRFSLDSTALHRAFIRRF